MTHIRVSPEFRSLVKRMQKDLEGMFGQELTTSQVTKIIASMQKSNRVIIVNQSRKKDKRALLEELSFFG